MYSFDSVCGIVHDASTESRWLHYSLETIEREIERERKKDRERERERERERDTDREIDREIEIDRYI